MLKTRQLEIFVAVARSRSMTRAASQLFVEQPAVTRQIQALEHDIGAKLFRKTKSGLDLTAAGAQLLKEAEEILDRIARLPATLASMSDAPAGPLALGAVPSLGSYILNTVASDFLGAFPRVALKVTEEISEELQASILAGRIDIGIVSAPLSRIGIDAVPFLSEPLCLIGAPAARRRMADPVAALRSASFILPSRTYSIRRAIDTYTAQAGIKPDVALEVDTIPLLKQIVASRRELGIAPYSAVHHEARAGTLIAVALPKLRIKRLLAVKSGRAMTPALQAMHELLLRTAERLLAEDTIYRR